MTMASDPTLDGAPASAATPAPRQRLPLRTRIIFFLLAWLIVLLPFLFWRSTWFGRELSDSEIAEYLRDDAKPRRIQHALVQVGNKIGKKDPGARQWYPDLVRLATHPVEEIRNTDAWLMGQDASQPAFHQALLGLLNDRSVLVRYNAALSLVSFGDASGRAQIVAMLRPMELAAPRSGRVTAAAKSADPVSHNTIVARIEDDKTGETAEVRSPIIGRIAAMKVGNGAAVTAGAPVAILEPGTEQVWEALRALYLVGTPEDLDAVHAWKRPLPDMPPRIQQQAELTEAAILARARQ